MKKISEKQRILGASNWLRATRQKLGWSLEELCERAAEQMRTHRMGDYAPTPETIAELENGALRQLPRWLRPVYYAFEKAQFDNDPDGHWSWLKSRNYHWADHPFDASHPMLFYDEYQMVWNINTMPEDRRRKIQAFIRAWSGPYEKDQLKTLRELLIALDVIDE